MNKDYSSFINEDHAYKELKKLLEQRLGRDLTKLEDEKINWFSNCEYETVGVFFDIFNELSKK